MLDIGWAELFLIGVIALIVIGPKDLPLAMRAVARVVRKMRALGQEFHGAMAEVVREAELDELKRKMEAASRVDLGEQVRRAVDPAGGLTEDFDPDAFAERLKRSVEGGPSAAAQARATPGGEAPKAATPGGEAPKAATPGPDGGGR